MNNLTSSASSRRSRDLLAATAVGAVILAVTAFVSPDRAWANTLLIGYYLITLGLGGALFIALTTVCGAGWNVAFRRVPESMTQLLPVAAAIVVPLVLLRLPHFGGDHHGDGGSGTFWFKELWLQPGFVIMRAVVYVLLWFILSTRLVAVSRRQDDHAGAGSSGRLPASIAFLFVFAITISLAGVDWIMVLEPMWFSTMWGIYQFSGLILAALSAMTIACVTLRREGPLDGAFRTEHLHDLGKLLLGFSCFWMYIWFSQYMLIWYSNIPEETSYFILRTQGAWGPVVVVSIMLNWVIPFFVLLPRPCKRSEGVMLKIAIVLLFGRWVDLYVMIFPPVTGPVPVFGLSEVAGMLLIGGVSGIVFLRAFSACRPVPENDPFLSESLSYHV